MNIVRVVGANELIGGGIERDATDSVEGRPCEAFAVLGEVLLTAMWSRPEDEMNGDGEELKDCVRREFPVFEVSDMVH